VSKYILGVDEGTTSARTIVFDEQANVVSQATSEITQQYPRSSWVEHDPNEILRAQKDTIATALERAKVSPRDIAAVGVTNQRETAIVWEKSTGKPVYNAIVWSSRQSAPVSQKWSDDGLDDKIREKTGLFNDAYYSASKIAWILENVDGAREKADRGELLAGTVDTWLIWNFTEGKRHVTEHSNAARTMMFNIADERWDEELLDAYGIPAAMLPEVIPSDGEFGDMDAVLGHAVPIRSALGDQQAGLYGQACFTKGQCKMTYGTAGVFVLNTGTEPLLTEGLTASSAWKVLGKTSYEAEGVNYSSGQTIKWLRDELKLLHASPDSEWYSGQVKDTQGVYLVPAFSGLAAPDWDMYARAAIIGMSSGTHRNHIIRAGIESMSYQTRYSVDAVTASGEVEIPSVRIDGGAVGNDVLCQFTADILGIPVVRPVVTEATVLGAAFVAGLASGIWSSEEELGALWKEDRTFEPSMSDDRRAHLYDGWKEAKELTKGWAKKVVID
jgi:glycerol kinase